jgi:hypothetical protein
MVSRRVYKVLGVVDLSGMWPCEAETIVVILFYS